MTPSRFVGLSFFLFMLSVPVYAAGGGNGAFISAPIQQLADLVSGDVGRAISFLAVAGLGMKYMADRSEDKGKNAIIMMIGVLCVVAPANMLSVFGIQGASF